MKTLGFIGMGNMGSAILNGLLRGNRRRNHTKRSDEER